MNTGKILSFLADLKKNNNREWFEDNRDRYHEVHEYFLEIVGELIRKLSRFDDAIGLLESKKCVYRIYRDIRFSKDKTPYKTNLGASISRGGRKSPFASYYLHLEPGGSFAGGGVYRPDPERLARIRQEIDYNGDELKSIMNRRPFKDKFGDFWREDTLIRPPKDYSEDNPYIDLIKLKSFVVFHKFSDTEVKKKRLPDRVFKVFTVMRPLIDYFNVAVS